MVIPPEAPARTLRVLFLCTAQLGAQPDRRSRDGAKSRTHGVRPLPRRERRVDAGTKVRPMAIEVLKTYGIDWEGRPKSIDAVRDRPWDLIITVCDRAKETCPNDARPAGVRALGNPTSLRARSTKRPGGARFNRRSRNSRVASTLLLALPVETLERRALETRVQQIAADVPVPRGTPA